MKVYASLTLVGAVAVQGVWACETPQVTGYERVECLNDGLSKVRKQGKFGAVNRSGQVIIPAEYHNLHFVGEGMVSVIQNGKLGLIDNTGKVILPVQYDRIAPFSEGLAGVSKGGKFGFVDTAGKFVIPLRYDSAYHSFENGQVVVSLDGQWFKIDKQGNRLP